MPDRDNFPSPSSPGGRKRERGKKDPALARVDMTHRIHDRTRPLPLYWEEKVEIADLPAAWITSLDGTHIVGIETHQHGPMLTIKRVQQHSSSYA